MLPAVRGGGTRGQAARSSPATAPGRRSSTRTSPRQATGAHHRPGRAAAAQSQGNRDGVRRAAVAPRGSLPRGLRAPAVPALAALAWAIVGLVRLIGRQVQWWWVLEMHALRSGAAAAGDSKEWMKLHKEAREVRKVHFAWIILGSELAAVGYRGLPLRCGCWRRGGRPIAAGGRGAARVLARAEAPSGGGQSSPRTIVPAQYEEPTPDVITDALGSLGASRASTRPSQEGRRGIAFDCPR